MKNQIELRFQAISENEALARTVISAFLVQADPLLSIVSEVRTAVSEAVTNAIVHAYCSRGSGLIILRASMDELKAEIEIEDFGCGIADIDRAMQPFYTSQPEMERTGMGFTLMQSFMDGIRVCSSPGNGTTVYMTKLLEHIREDAV